MLQIRDSLHFPRNKQNNTGRFVFFTMQAVQSAQCNSTVCHTLDHTLTAGLFILLAYQYVSIQ